MKCPTCGAWTEVLDSIMRTDGSRRRRYRCANDHRFTTLEMIVKTTPGNKAEIGPSSIVTKKMEALRSIEQTVQRLLNKLAP